MRRALTLLILALATVACGQVQEVGSGDGGGGTTTTTEASRKVFVCKYVGTPGVDERLQTGQNPISVSVNAIPAGASVGAYFADAQGRSLVIAFDTGQGDPDCPTPQNPTTTTSSSTTSTTTTDAATTTTTCPDCVPNTNAATTTTSTPGPTTVAPSTSTTQPGTTTTAPPGATTTTLPATFTFAGATTVCRAEVPTIVIDFASPGFPSLAGQTGTLTMSAVNGGAVLSTQPLVYQPGGHVELLYPGTRVNPDGTIADVPGWNLNAAGLWVRDPADAFLRDGILLTFTVNPTATATVTYPPESSACANPENPPVAPPPGTPTTTIPGLPSTK